MNVEFLGNSLKESGEDSQHTMECPKCGCEYLHIDSVAVAPFGIVYKNNGVEVNGGITHGKRDKVLTFFRCENCTNHRGDSQIVRIEVVHKGMLQCGIYFIKEGINIYNLHVLKVAEND